MGAYESGRDHFACWHTGDRQATEVILSPGITRFVHDAIVLTIHAFGSLAAAFLAEIHDGLLRSLREVDLNAVVRVDHKVRCVDELSIGQSEAESGAEWTLR